MFILTMMTRVGSIRGAAGAAARRERGVLDLAIGQTPLVVVDVEATGLKVETHDRAIEIAVVRVEPGERGRVVFDSLIRGERAVVEGEHGEGGGGGAVHGISPGEVAGAPAFGDVAGELVRALSGAVVVGFNVYFDVRAIAAELGRCGVGYAPPFVCVARVMEGLGLGARIGLAEACVRHGVALERAHRAREDALAAAGLWEVCAARFESRGVRRFRDLRRLGRYKFTRSLTRDLAG